MVFGERVIAILTVAPTRTAPLWIPRINLLKRRCLQRKDS